MLCGRKPDDRASAKPPSIRTLRQPFLQSEQNAHFAADPRAGKGASRSTIAEAAHPRYRGVLAASWFIFVIDIRD